MSEILNRAAFVDPDPQTIDEMALQVAKKASARRVAAIRAIVEAAKVPYANVALGFAVDEILRNHGM